MGSGVGAKLTCLILEPRSWVHQKVDTVTFGSEGDCRLSIFLDLYRP